MEGKRDEVLVKRAKACEEKNKKRLRRMELPLTIVVLLPHVSSMTSLVMHIFLTLFLVRQSSSHLVTIPPPLQ